MCRLGFARVRPMWGLFLGLKVLKLSGTLVASVTVDLRMATPGGVNMLHHIDMLLGDTEGWDFGRSKIIWVMAMRASHTQLARDFNHSLARG